MMNTKTLLEKTQEFEKQSRLADDKAKADLVAGTPAKLWRGSAAVPTTGTPLH